MTDTYSISIPTRDGFRSPGTVQASSEAEALKIAAEKYGPEKWQATLLPRAAMASFQKRMKYRQRSGMWGS